MMGVWLMLEASSFVNYYKEQCPKAKWTEDLFTNFFLMLGKQVCKKKLMALKELRLVSLKYFEEVFSKVDVLILLNSCTINKRIQQKHIYNGVMDSGLLLANLLYQFIPTLGGLPVTTLNLELDDIVGTPISVQLVGRWGNEEFLLNLSHFFETSGYPFIKHFKYYSPFDDV